MVSRDLLPMTRALLGRSSVSKPLQIAVDSVVGTTGPLFLAPPVEYAADAPASVERFLLLRV